MKAQNKTQLSYIFSLIASEPGTDIYAIDPDTQDVIASTRDAMAGVNAEEVGFKKADLSVDDQVFFETINGQKSLCIYEKNNTMILANVRSSSKLFGDLMKSTALLAIYVIILAGTAMFFIVRYLNKNIVHGIYDINDKLVEIEKGNLLMKMPPQPSRKWPNFPTISTIW